jgi:hypothetical protein
MRFQSLGSRAFLPAACGCDKSREANAKATNVNGSGTPTGAVGACVKNTPLAEVKVTPAGSVMPSWLVWLKSMTASIALLCRTKPSKKAEGQVVIRD